MLTCSTLRGMNTMNEMLARCVVGVTTACLLPTQLLKCLLLIRYPFTTVTLLHTCCNGNRRHVIISTNATAERLFPCVPDVEHPSFFRILDKLASLNNQLLQLNSSNTTNPSSSSVGPASAVFKGLKRLVLLERVAAHVVALFLLKPRRGGSYDLAEHPEQLMY
jgi:hypothetical protein